MAKCQIYPDFSPNQKKDEPCSLNLAVPYPRDKNGNLTAGYLQLDGPIDLEDNRHAIDFYVQQKYGSMVAPIQRDAIDDCIIDPALCQLTQSLKGIAASTNPTRVGTTDKYGHLLMTVPRQRSGGQPMRVDPRRQGISPLDTPKGDAHSTIFSNTWERHTVRNEALCSTKGIRCGNEPSSVYGVDTIPVGQTPPTVSGLYAKITKPTRKTGPAPLKEESALMRETYAKAKLGPRRK